MKGSTPVDNKRDIGENSRPMGWCHSHIGIIAGSPITQTLHGQVASIVQGWMNNGEYPRKDGGWETDVLTPLSAGRTGQILRYSWNVIGSLTDNMIISTSQWRRDSVWPSICHAGENSRQPKISKSSLKYWCVVRHDLLEILLSRG